MWQLLNKNVVAKFGLWKSNAAAVRQFSRESGQTARVFSGTVKLLDHCRGSILRWKSIRAWQQRAFESKEVMMMCDKMGGVVDARMSGQTFAEWKKTVRNLLVCRFAVDRNYHLEKLNLMRAGFLEWHSVASLESKRRQIIGILRSRLPRKVISAWTHSFVWRQCVDARSVGTIRRICYR